MQELFQKLSKCQEPLEIIIDPEIGSMELQEIGIADRIEYNQRIRFAYAQGLTIAVIRQLLTDVSENLGIREDEPEIIDKLSDKIYKSLVEFDYVKEDDSFWVTFWYDARIGHLHRQGKMEIYIRPNTKYPPEKFDFYDAKKRIWIEKIALDIKKDNPYSIEFDQLNEYIKKKNLLWLLEEIAAEGYDIWDFLEDINRKIEE